MAQQLEPVSLSICGSNIRQMSSEPHVNYLCRHACVCACVCVYISVHLIYAWRGVHIPIPMVVKHPAHHSSLYSLGTDRVSHLALPGGGGSSLQPKPYTSACPWHWFTCKSSASHGKSSYQRSHFPSPYPCILCSQNTAEETHQ